MSFPQSDPVFHNQTPFSTELSAREGVILNLREQNSRKMRKTPKFGGVQACLCVDKSVDNVENPVDSFEKPSKYTKFRPPLTGFSAISTFFAAE